jgi:hypothetical protein
MHFTGMLLSICSPGGEKVGNVKLNIAIANTLILRLDVAQERRMLTPMELWLRRMLKQSVLGLASLERTMARQRSRIRWLKEGDANTALFHAVANGRRVKNHIAAVKVGDDLVTEQNLKVEAFTEAYFQLLGQTQPREHSINLDELDIPTAELQDLDAMFTEEEIWGWSRTSPRTVRQDRMGSLELFTIERGPLSRGTSLPDCSNLAWEMAGALHA